MKRYTLSVLIALSLLTIPSSATYASESEGHHELTKGVNKEVEKIENGVIIKITSDDPETAKRIQERAAEHKDTEPCQPRGNKHRHGERCCRS